MRRKKKDDDYDYDYDCDELMMMIERFEIQFFFLHHQHHQWMNAKEKTKRVNLT